MILTKFNFVCKRFKWTQAWIFDQKADAGTEHLNDPEAFIEDLLIEYW